MQTQTLPTHYKFGIPIRNLRNLFMALTSTEGGDLLMATQFYRLLHKAKKYGSINGDPLLAYRIGDKQQWLRKTGASAEVCNRTEKALVKAELLTVHQHYSNTVRGAQIYYSVPKDTVHILHAFARAIKTIDIGPNRYETVNNAICMNTEEFVIDWYRIRPKTTDEAVQHFIDVFSVA